MEHQKYNDIQRLGIKNTCNCSAGDYIFIEEKIDGANAGIRYDATSDMLVAQSRNHLLDEKDSLRGFYNYVQKLDKDLFKSVLKTNLILFCEWLVPHSVVYPQEAYNQAYCYDVFDTNTNTYLHQSDAKAIVTRLGMTFVPVFYEGEFISWEHCMSFVGRTELGGEYGEGVVVKNMEKLTYTKIVGERFSETKGHKIKVVSPEELRSKEEQKAIVSSIVTRARVEKMLNKFVDEEIIPEDWCETSMGVIAKNLNTRIFQDCLKEENETVLLVNDFGKISNSICMGIAKQILNERGLK